MTRATIPQSLLSAAARTARAEGVTVEIARNGTVVRIAPDGKPLATRRESSL